MTPNEYDELLKAIESKRDAAITTAAKSVNDLDQAYATINNPFKIGMLIGFGNVVIRIDKLTYSSTFSSHPYMIAKGYVQTKQLKNRLDKSRGTIRGTESWRRVDG